MGAALGQPLEKKDGNFLSFFYFVLSRFKRITISNTVESVATFSILLSKLIIMELINPPI